MNRVSALSVLDVALELDQGGVSYIPQPETQEEFEEELKKGGIQVLEVYEPGDGILCVFEDGELQLTAYLTSRGDMYQVGAFDGETEFGKTNIPGMGSMVDEWRKVEPGAIWACSAIARGPWKMIANKTPYADIEAEEDDW